MPVVVVIPFIAIAGTHRLYVVQADPFLEVIIKTDEGTWFVFLVGDALILFKGRKNARQIQLRFHIEIHGIHGIIVQPFFFQQLKFHTTAHIKLEFCGRPEQIVVAVRTYEVESERALRIRIQLHICAEGVSFSRGTFNTGIKAAFFG